ncbi:MAG: 2-oxo acid dehydrogenase subunit E2 [Propionibacteriaceae bacterium]|nr:2-oxo acid dehydrogenase subunit E2 [Propionibacteriaceae bacterium]
MSRVRRRHDAIQVQLPNTFNGIFPYVMRGRNESILYYPIKLDAGPLLAYVEASKGTDHEISLFEAGVICMVKLLRARPTLNRYVAGRRLWQRRDVVVSFIAKRAYSDDAPETNIQVTIRPHDDVKTLLAKVRGQITSVKSGEDGHGDKIIETFMKMPRFVLRTAVAAMRTWDFYVDTPGFLRGKDPLRCSVFISNLGSVGIDAPYHHLYEWGNCSVFMAMGKIHKDVVVGKNGRPAVADVLQLRMALDERICDGYYDARSLDLFEEYLTHPELLETI